MASNVQRIVLAILLFSSICTSKLRPTSGNDNEFHGFPSKHLQEIEKRARNKWPFTSFHDRNSLKTRRQTSFFRQQTWMNFDQNVSYHSALKSQRKRSLPIVSVSMTPSRLQVLGGSMASFFCHFRAIDLSSHLGVKLARTDYDSIEVTWLKSDRLLPSRSRFSIARINTKQPDIGGSILRINPLKDGKDTGAYECRVEKGGIVLGTANALLEVIDEDAVPQGFPEILDPPISKNVERNKSVTLSCRSIGNPPPTIHWLKNSFPVNLSNPRITILPSGSLEILRTTEEDESNYECYALNNIGVSFSQPAQLVIKGRYVPPYFHPGMTRDIILEYGESKDIKCIAGGTPVPWVKWMKGDQELNTESLGDSVLRVENIAESSEYTCLARSDIGLIAQKVAIHVASFPSSPRNVRATEVYPTSARIEWIQDRFHNQNYKQHHFSSKHSQHFYAPSQAPVEVRHWVVRYQMRNDSSTLKQTDEVYTKWVLLMGLKPFTTYEARVIAVGISGNSLPSPPMDFLTAEDGWFRGLRSCNGSYGFAIHPGIRNPSCTARERIWGAALYKFPTDAPILSIVEMADQHSALVHWTECLLPNGHIKGYTLLHSHSLVLPHSKWVSHNLPLHPRNFTISNLQADQNYFVCVKCFTGKGDGPCSRPVEFKPSVVSSPPSFLVAEELRITKLESINSSSLLVRWFFPPPQDSPIGDYKGFRIYYVRIRDDGPLNPTELNIDDVKAREAVLDNLMSDTFYEVQMSVLGKSGSETSRTKPKRVKTKGLVPSPPRNLKLSLVNSTSFFVDVSWSTPKESHGPLEGYTLKYAIVGNPIYNEKRFDADRRHFTTNSLVPGEDYEFQVSAKNHQGFGEVVVGVIRTPDGAPVGPPQNFTAMGLSPTSVKLHWDPPKREDQRGNIITYEVMHYNRNIQHEATCFNLTDKSTVIEKLSTNTDYIFQARAYTSRGSGPWSNKLPFRTFGQYGLGAPTNLKMRRISQTDIELLWDPPFAPSSASIKGYEIEYYPRDIIDHGTKLKVIVGPFSSFQLAGLDANVPYAVRVRAKGHDDKFGNFSDVFYTKNFENVHPSSPQEVQAQVQNGRTAQLIWKPPQKFGVLRYKIEYMGVRRSGTADGKVQETILDPLKEVILEKNDLRHQMAALLPRTIYIVNITSLFMDKTWGIPFTVKFETGNASNMLKVEAPVLVQSASSNSPAIIQLQPASFDTVLAYYVIVLSTKVAQNVKSDDVKLDVLISQTWLNKPREVQPNWIAGSFDSASLPWQMILGDESRPGTGEYVNYRLQPSNEEENFVAFLRVITTSEEQYSSEYSPPLFSGSSQIPVTFPHSTEPIIHILPQLDPQESSSESVTHHDGSSIAAPLCVTLLFMLLFVGLFFFARKRRYAFKWTLPEPWKLILPSNEVPSYLQIDPVEMRRQHLQTPAMMSHPPVAVNEFEKHVQAMLTNDGILFAQEYESIEPGQQYMCENSELEVNKPKNRYDDVLAFDHSRVILRSQDGGPAAAGIDYINANFVDGFRRQNAYIATQGPLPTTFADFWKMVWEQRSAAIVMMTRLEENHKVRCHQYWPDKGTQTYGQINVTILDSIELSNYTIRTFSIFNESNNNEPREVQHFQFTSWSDEGVPDNPMPLLLFMRRLKFLVTPDSGPVIVHCSAGCGRSGVYIVIDSMLERIKHLRTIDVYGHVTCLRCQRNFMVQTEEQYVFIHRALIQAIKYGNTEIPTRNFKQHLERLQAKQSFGLRFEYQRLFSPDFNPRMFESAISPKNLSKNRNKDFLPNDATRVLLDQTRGGDDFINASFIDGYVFKQSYILAQNPLRDTVEDFWRMVISTRCQTLVMLTDFINEQDACVCYWPTDRPLRFQKFVVELLSEQSKLDYILRQFSITPNETGVSTTVRQFQLTDWNIRSVLTVAKELQKIRQNKNKNTFSPAILHCSDGVGRSGVACTVMTAIERLQFEGVIDIFQTVCVARHQRNGFIRNEEQYDMCHQVIVQYLDDAYTH